MLKLCPNTLEELISLGTDAMFSDPTAPNAMKAHVLRESITPLATVLIPWPEILDIVISLGSDAVLSESTVRMPISATRLCSCSEEIDIPETLAAVANLCSEVVLSGPTLPRAISITDPGQAIAISETMSANSCPFVVFVPWINPEGGMLSENMLVIAKLSSEPATTTMLGCISESGSDPVTLSETINFGTDSFTTILKSEVVLELTVGTFRAMFVPETGFSVTLCVCLNLSVWASFPLGSELDQRAQLDCQPIGAASWLVVVFLLPSHMLIVIASHAIPFSEHPSRSVPAMPGFGAHLHSCSLHRFCRSARLLLLSGLSLPLPVRLHPLLRALGVVSDAPVPVQRIVCRWGGLCCKGGVPIFASASSAQSLARFWTFQLEKMMNKSYVHSTIFDCWIGASSDFDLDTTLQPPDGEIRTVRTQREFSPLQQSEGSPELLSLVPMMPKMPPMKLLNLPQLCL
ncbi:hypothetical protein ZIOFF_018054 [Zingiber officinale]|uniref:Uncharacterized protein n=1 Tax=Zingiber officinale TaxID=94328 RepID=A0A8J5H5X9_ZINOF|nr:hypothetical protein ZIOFF_018054 [Zingiber officinale]